MSSKIESFKLGIRDFNSELSSEENENAAGARANPQVPLASTNADCRESLGARALVNKCTQPPPLPPRSSQSAVDTARTAVAPLAAALPGHGVDLDSFVAAYGSGTAAAASPATTAAAARLAFMRAALTNTPSLAGRAVDYRLQGTSSETREIVNRSLGARTGFSRYSECERVLAGLRGFPAEQRADILGIMKTGVGFDLALADERAALQKAGVGSASTTASPSLESQLDSAIREAEAERIEVRDTTTQMTRVLQGLPRLTRGAEFAVGLGSGILGSGTLGFGIAATAATLDVAPAEEALAELERAGGYMHGELTEQNQRASQLYESYLRDSIAYDRANRAYQNALRSSDPEPITGARAEMDQLLARMAINKDAFVALANNVAERDKNFNRDTLSTAIGILVMGGSVAHGLTHRAATTASKVVQLAHAVRNSTIEAGVTKLIVRGIEEVQDLSGADGADPSHGK